MCADELGPAVPRTFPPAPGWSPGGHRVKAPPGVFPRAGQDLGRGGLRVKDGQTFAGSDEIACATRVATARLNARARPWVWGRPKPQSRFYRRRFAYLI
jgi:hypothetical protein